MAIKFLQFSRSRYLFFVLILALFACTNTQPNKSIDNNTQVVYLVRHAEKASQTKDPELTEKGKERALALASTLENANIDHIHSTNFIRTKETAAPLANKLGIDAKLYDHKNLEDLVQKIKVQGGNHLVVGHSKSTPSMARLLGGNPGSAIDDKNEFDRIYIISDFERAPISSILLSYGPPSK